jgi:transglutaminase-like putative cysteine protease
MIIDISHQLHLALSAGIARTTAHLLLTPLSGPSQTILDWAIEMPGIETAARLTDAYGNRALLVTQARPGDELTITVTGRVETHDRNGVLGRIPGEPVVALYRRATALTAADPRLVDAFRDADRSGTARIALLHAVMGRLGELYRFDGEAAPAGAAQAQAADGQSHSVGAAGGDDRPAADAATFAHGFVGAVRWLGIPARYVSGYLAGDSERPARFHAWAEAYDDGLGWIGFDAALNLCPTDRHVRVAVGLDGQTTMPLRVVPQPGPATETVAAVATAAQ